MTTDNPQAEASESVRVNFSEADHLFLDDLADVGDILTSDAEVTKLLWVIQRIEGEIDSLKETKKQHKEFYDAKIENAENQIDFLKGRIERYLHTKGEDKLATPNGTAYFSKRETYNYPNDDVLLEYAKANNLEYKVKEKPLKTPIKEFIDSGGQPPEGFSIDESVTLVIREKLKKALMSLKNPH